MKYHTDRRKFIKRGVIAAATLSVIPSDALARGDSPSEREARKVIQAFLDATNRGPTGDLEGIRNACNFPHIRIAGGGVRIWQSRDEMTGDIAQRLAQEGRAYGKYHSVKFVQSSDDKVHATFVFDRYRADGKRYATYQTLWIITKQNGHWGIQCRSSFAP